MDDLFMRRDVDRELSILSGKRLASTSQLDPDLDHRMRWDVRIQLKILKT